MQAISLATAAVVPPVRTSLQSVLCGSALRALHLWHLLSLDAPTVALCWTLAFARSAGVPHAWPAAFALACAVWAVYAADRVLDVPASGPLSHPLHRMYARHHKAFLLACPACGAAAIVLLSAVPLPLRLCWVALGLPLLGYALAVHRFRMPGAWKPWCVGGFFAVAVSLPAWLHTGLRWDWIAAGAAFGTVCLENCRLLRDREQNTHWLKWSTEAALCQAWAALPLLERETRTIAWASAGALALMWLLHHLRGRFCPLTYRALADAALVLPALLVLLLT